MISTIITRTLPFAIRSSYLRPFTTTSMLATRKPAYFFSNTQKTNQQKLEQVKQQSQQFYNTQLSDIIDLKQTSDFVPIVQGSEVPIVINFYADWNLACKTMAPKLEARVKGADGQLKLLNINIDKFGDVAKVFQVKAVPTIYLIYQGKAIDSFSGQISDELLGKFIETATRATSFDKGEVAVTKSIEEAQIALSKGEFAKTEKILIDLKTSHLKEEYGLVKDIFLAYAYAQLGKITNLKSLVQAMKKNEQFYVTKPQFKDLYLNLVERCQQIQKAKQENSEFSEWRSKLEKQPNNLQLKYDAAAFYQQNQLYEQALIELLAIVKANKEWQQKKANKTILEIFKKLGNVSPITQNYRKLLQRALH